MIPRRITLVLGFLVALFAESSPASVELFSPQGEVARVRQVTARFGEQIVKFGDPRARDPFDVRCEEKGVGRWIDGRTWSYDFDRDLPAGVRCEFSLKPRLRSLSGAPVTAAKPFVITTGGPKIALAWPRQGYGRVKEQQVFLVELSVPALEASVREHARCRITGSGEEMPVTLLPEADVKALEKRHSISEKNTRPRLALQCRDALDARTPFQLVWGKGISALSGVASEREQSLGYVVRDPFGAQASCGNDGAIDGCNPGMNVTLTFTAPVPWSIGEQVRLRLADGSMRAPKPLEHPYTASQFVEFRGPFPQNTDVTVVLPADVRDRDGRALTNAASFLQTVRIGEPAPAIGFPMEFGIIERNAGSAFPITLQNVEEKVPLRRLRVGAPKMLPDDVELIEWIGRFENAKYRDKSLLADVAAAESHVVRKRLGPKPREDVLIPFRQPGYYILELESERLASHNKGLRDARYPRVAALVTNLSVHLKYGPENALENALIWVTRIDTAAPVGAAQVAVRDCNGRLLWESRTNAQGLARVDQALPEIYGKPCIAALTGYFVSARTADDVGFMLTRWRYPAGYGFYRRSGRDLQEPTGWAAHTVLDRMLFRVGETVGMKHYVRRETSSGLTLARGNGDMTITHQGTNKSYQVPLKWDAAGTSEASWTIPEDAKLGSYQIRIAADGHGAVSGTFRVEEFRLPTMVADLSAGARHYFNAREVPYQMRLAYLSGGAAQQPVRLRSALTPRFVDFEGYEGFAFAGPSRDERPEPTILIQDLQIKLDEKGEARTVVKNMPRLDSPADLATEMEFADANGEVQTVSSLTRVWPAAIALGMKQRRPPSGTTTAMELQTVALDPEGRALPNTELRVEMTLRSRRLELPAGRDEDALLTEHIDETPLGVACTGRTDARGLLQCTVKPGQTGEIVFTASTRDAEDNLARASISAWFGPDEISDVSPYREEGTEIELYPDRAGYRPGETARLQLRVPYDRTWVLITTEREGIAEARVQVLDAGTRELDIPIRGTYAPNVYVSVLMLAGRRGDGNATRTADPGKPWFFFGTRELRVAHSAHALAVQVTADRATYRPRERATVRVKVVRPDGTPAGGAEAALAAVDDALLQLFPNTSWKLLDALLKRRPKGVQSGTALSQIVGRRAISDETIIRMFPAVAGGGLAFASMGGHSPPEGGTKDPGGPARELFDTLLKWQARLKLDANGEATVEVPFNDSLTAFRIVAVAHMGNEQFGTGETLVTSSTPLQVISGLPPLVREGDSFRAMATLRNTGDQPMRVEFSANARRGAGSAVSGVTAITRTVELKPGESRDVSWPVSVPVGSDSLVWELAARNASGPERDAVRIAQRVMPAVPVTVQQATLAQLDDTLSMKVALPRGAIPGRGGVSVHLRARLADGLDGVRRFMSQYPYSCLEQQVSRAVALRDEAAWRRIIATLGSYLDGDGLLRYFPDPRLTGSDALTAYLLAIAHESGWQVPEEFRTRMISGLTGVVEDRVLRSHWSPRADLDVRKLAAIEALSRYSAAHADMLKRIHVEPNAWPTSAVIDWIGILLRLASLPSRNELLGEAQQILRARLNLQGTTMGFSTERDDYWWWLMVSPDSNSVRTILLLLDAASWKEDMPRMVRGVLQRQRYGRWHTTTANAWGVLAMEKFSRRFESQPVSGATRASLAKMNQLHEWKAQAEGGELRFDWPGTAGTIQVEQRGTGKPWVTVQSLAAVPLTVPFSSGYKIAKRITPLQQKTPGAHSRGDVLRVTLDLEAQSNMTWVVVKDPIPAGATLLGRGFGRDSEILAAGEERKGWVRPAYEDRALDAFRAYYAYVPKGKWSVEYTVRLNNDGTFEMPQTRVEAMYAPEMFGELPNARVVVKP